MHRMAYQTKQSWSITPWSGMLREYALTKYTELPDYTVARLFCEENPEYSSDRTRAERIETARQSVRHWRGHRGNKKRNSSGVVPVPLNNDTRNMKAREMPATRSAGLKHFHLPTGQREVLFLSDIHVPYHEPTPLRLALEYGVKHKVDTVWINGDFLDMYQGSTHEKLPTMPQIREEFEIGRELLEHIRGVLPDAQIYWLEGNHELRWKRLLARKAPEIFGDPEWDIPVRMKLAELSIHYIPNGTLCHFGKLHVIHGNEFKGGGGVNPARSLFLKAKVSTIAGDKHKTGENNEGSLAGKLITTWSVGCLCELNPGYMPFGHTIWNHGFAHISIDGEDFHVRNFRIHNDRIM